MKFAGDSMIIAFSPSDGEKSDLDEGLRASTLRCLQCASALAMQLGMQLQGIYTAISMQGQVCTGTSSSCSSNLKDHDACLLMCTYKLNLPMSMLSAASQIDIVSIT